VVTAHGEEDEARFVAHEISKQIGSIFFYSRLFLVSTNR